MNKKRHTSSALLTIFWFFIFPSTLLLSEMKEMEVVEKSNKFSHNDLITERL